MRRTAQGRQVRRPPQGPLAAGPPGRAPRGPPPPRWCGAAVAQPRTALLLGERAGRGRVALTVALRLSAGTGVGRRRRD